MRRFAAALPALLLAACAENPAGPSVLAGQEFQLRTGESVGLQGTDLRVQFEAVASDSRCPADAVCVTLGDAEAILTVARASGPATSLTLHTAPDKARSANVGEWALALSRLDPYPYAGVHIAPREYRATLRADRVPGS